MLTNQSLLHAWKERPVRGALSAFAVLVALSACSHKATVTTASAAPTAVPTNALDSAPVDSKNYLSVSQQVAQSTLPLADKSAFAAMIEQHRAKPATLDGKNVREIINEERAYEMGVRMAADARAADTAHRRKMAAVIDLTAPAHRDGDHQLVLTLRVQNKTGKTIRLLDTGIEIHDAKNARIGLAEFEVTHPVPPHSTVTFPFPVVYLRFGEDAGLMRMARGKPKTMTLDVKEIKYTDGTDAGYDD